MEGGEAVLERRRVLRKEWARACRRGWWWGGGGKAVLEQRGGCLERNVRWGCRCVCVLRGRWMRGTVSCARLEVCPAARTLIRKSSERAFMGESVRWGPWAFVGGPDMLTWSQG